MHLPEHIDDKWSIDINRESLEKGDTVYYAPDGVIHIVEAVSDKHIQLRDTWENESWVANRKPWCNNLFRDIYPLKEN